MLYLFWKFERVIFLSIYSINLWENGEHDTTITAYIPEKKKTNGAIVIFPGGGYTGRAEHEGKAYAEYFNGLGITAFVCNYRVYPNHFPLPLLDARRAMRFLRYNAEKFGIDKDKIFAIGSSAGGHLTALLSTYLEKIDGENVDEIDKESFLPNAQILCYPVIKLLGKGVAHLGSGLYLLGERHGYLGEELSPDLIAEKGTPKAFIWHTFEDQAVNVINSLDYAKRLKQVGTDVEMHIYPYGVHGLGLAEDDLHVNQWVKSLVNWFNLVGFMD